MYCCFSFFDTVHTYVCSEQRKKLKLLQRGRALHG